MLKLLGAAGTRLVDARQFNWHRKRDEPLPRDRRHAGLDLPRRALKSAPVDSR
jgi:hypothetical protein